MNLPSTSKAEVQGVFSNSERYTKCMTLARNDPRKANKLSEIWIDENGGAPAQHCLAISEFFGGSYKKAANILERLSKDTVVSDLNLRVQVLSQAGQAWLLGSQTERAIQNQSQAIALSKGDPQLYLDRATSQIVVKNYKSALVDLERAIKKEPTFGDAYLYRSIVKRYVNDLPGALADINKALALTPELPAALLERGIIRRYLGQLDRAREDWMKIFLIAPKSTEANIAQKWMAKTKIR